MSKRLILILALVFVAGIAVAAYAEVQNVKVSGDITALGILRNLNLKGDNNNATERALASITRARIDADLTDNVMATVRLLNERYWGLETENNPGSGENTNIDLDLAMVTLKEFLYSPVTLTVGRQELHFGNDMIVGDVDTNNAASAASPFGSVAGADDDLSARKAFDAIRLTLNYEPLVINAIAAKVTEGSLRAQDDVDLYGVNANYTTKNKLVSTVEAYWFEKRTGRQSTAGLTAGKKVDRIDTIGARMAGELKENLTASLEAAYQFGQYVGSATTPTVQRKAWAVEAAATYNMPKKKYTPSITGLYAYFSGDHENTAYTTNAGAYKGWDPMFENQKFGDIANALFAQTNAHILGGMATCKPMDDITLKGEYYAFWWAKAYPAYNGLVSSSTVGLITSTARDASVNLQTTGKRFAGQEIDLTATYDYTEDVQFALMGGWFLPGASFAKTNKNPATEVIGSMKVTF